MPAIILSIMAATLLWYFNQLGNTVERTFRLKPEIRISEQMIPLQSPRYVTVKVKGEGEKLENIEPRYFTVVADFSNLTDEGEHEGVIRVEVPDYFEGLEISTSPSYLKITLEKKITRAVKVQVNTRGAVKAGYEVEIGVPAPDEVMVTGARSEMAGLEFLETEVVDMEELTENISPGSRFSTLDQTVRLLPIQGGYSSLVFDRDIEILYSVRARELVKQFTVENIYIFQIDSDNRFTYTLEKEYADLKLSGPELLINRLPISKLNLAVELGDISEAGEYILPVIRMFDDVSDEMKEITDLGLEPSEIKVIVEPK